MFGVKKAIKFFFFKTKWMKQHPDTIPMNQFDPSLVSVGIDINYMFIWDNSTWKRTWSNVKEYSNDWAPLYDQSKSVEQNNDGILAELKYGEEKEWKEHFDYLRPFFEDERYIKVNGKPVFLFL